MSEHDSEAVIKTLPIACNLSDAGEVEARRRVIEEIFSGVTRRDELSDGYEFSFPGDDAWAARLMEFVAAERRCCPFLHFELVFHQGCGPVHLRLRGAEGVKDFIRDWTGAL